MIISEENHTARVTLEDNGMIRVCFLHSEKNEISLSEMIDTVDLMVKLSGNQRRAFLIDMTSMMRTLPLESLKYLGTHPTLNSLRRAEAFATDSLVDEMILKFYQKLDPVYWPLRIFKDIQQAEEWLGSYLGNDTD